VNTDSFDNAMFGQSRDFFNRVGSPRSAGCLFSALAAAVSPAQEPRRFARRNRRDSLLFAREFVARCRAGGCRPSSSGGTTDVTLNPYSAGALAGRRTWDTRDEFCASVCFMSAGVLLRRPAHTKTSCVGFRETQGQRVQIPISPLPLAFNPQWNSFIPFGLPFFARAKKV